MEPSAPLPPLCLPERFAESWINAPSHIVMGVRLREFSLWHRMLFEAFGLPWGRSLGKGEAPVAPGPLHLASAVQICRTSYEQQPDFSPLAVLAKPRRSLWQKIRVRRQMPRGFEGELAAFMRYLTDYCAPPEIWEAEKKGRPGNDKAPANARPPSTLTVATRLIATGFTQREAWEMPEGQAHWYSATALWIAGDPVPFISESDETLNFLAKLKERIARRKARKKAQEENKDA